MFENISNKRKFYAILVLFVVLGITAYKRSFKHTIASISLYSESKKSITENENAESTFIKLKQEASRLNGVIGKKNKNPEIIQNKILNFIDTQGFSSKISEISPLHYSENNYFKIYSNNITLTGDFNNLLASVYQFEKEFDFARIASVKLYTKNNYRISKKELYCNIIFQNYENKK